MRWLLLVLAAACGGPAPAPCPVCPAAEASPPFASKAIHPEGAWHGVLAGTLHTVLHITRQGDKLGGVLDSLDQGSKLPIDSVKIDGAQVRFDVAVVNGFYEGTIEGNTMKGTWTQNGVAQPLSFERGEGSRPPPPKPLDAPIDVEVGTPPLPLRADDKTVLVYELHVANLYPATIEIRSIDVSAAGHPLLHIDGDTLGPVLAHGRPQLAANTTNTVFLWVTLDSPAVPAALDHRIVVHVLEGDMTVSDVRVPVVDRTPVVVAPPLRGGPWRADNGPSNGSTHRRSLISIGGRARIAQRFAIDWVKQGPDGKTFSGDRTNNKSYLAYGQDALAVADGVVTEVKDGIAENVPGQRAVPITLETIAGNHVVVDIGSGRWALWAHLQPGTLKVRVGDRVKRGQVLGLVGNSGNSTEPHLHFQVMDGPSHLASEGVPYAFDAFETSGAKRSKQLPTEEELVTFR